MDLQYRAKELGAGFGSEDLVVSLCAGQLTKRLAMLGILFRESGQICPDDVEKSRFVESYRALVGLHQAHPVLVNGLLAYPSTGVWLAHCLRRIRSAETAHDDIWPDLGYLGWLTATALVELGAPTHTAVVVRAGQVMLPTVGLAQVAATEEYGLGRLYVHGPNSIAIEFEGTKLDIADTAYWEQPGWRPLERVRAAGSGFEAVIDDLDPFREFNDPSRSASADRRLPRLSRDQLRDWREAFAAAWVLMEQDHPGYAKPISMGLRSFVPLTAEPISPSSSRTSYDSFGCIAASSTRSSHQMALTLIHEFQHAKLGAFTDMVELYEEDPRERFYAPWRDDPRPIEWLLQGMYAHLGVTDFWRAERLRTRSELAHVEFARWRTQVHRSIAEILESGVLTMAGLEFVQAAAETLRPWLDEEVTDSAALIADEAASGHWVAWCVRNLQVADSALENLFSAWKSAERPHLENVPVGLPTRPDRKQPELRSRLLPSYLQVLEQTPSRNVDRTRDLAPGDMAYGSGNYVEAVTHYKREIEAGPMLPQPWAGLALALQRLRPVHEVSALPARGEVVAQLYTRICATGASCDPADLVYWLSSDGPQA
ncbi:HEXXH motif domain-containing protein [Nocardia brevicatena]|uniref:HEXXH motif domain-containing protein n=1 Tax=Nocardia brevicatena TaxID=37327 RepID=UPI0005928149|nr:HEXXH motif domain-containing protein [Nocardia brevicatena]